MSDGFCFPALPKPKPLVGSPRNLPVSNPLLAGATVSDRTAAAAAAPTATAPLGSPAASAAGTQDSQAKAAGGAAPVEGLSGTGDVDGSMGAALGKPVVLSRHHRIAPARKKVPFEIGYSQMDWVRTTQKHPDLAGLGGKPPRRGIPMEEVALHCTQEDCWTVLRGKVYNITHYLKFHPGGMPLLLKVAGKDGTALFTKFHAWVNYDFMLAKCLVGMLAPPSSVSSAAVPAANGTTYGSGGGSTAPASLGASSNNSSFADLPAQQQQQQQHRGEGDAAEGLEEEQQRQAAAVGGRLPPQAS